MKVSYESQQEIQLMRFADYFGRSFAAVAGSQFPWLKLFRESAISKIADVSTIVFTFIFKFDNFCEIQLFFCHIAMWFPMNKCLAVHCGIWKYYLGSTSIIILSKNVPFFALHFFIFWICPNV